MERHTKRIGRSRSWGLLVVVPPLVGVAVLAACSSDERAGATPSGTSTTTTVGSTIEATVDTAGSGDPSTYRTTVEELCTAWRDADDRGGFPVDGFSPDEPDPALLPEVGAYFLPWLGASEPWLERIEAVPAPPELLDAHGTFVAALWAEHELALVQANAAADADVDAFTATLPDVIEARDVLAEAAIELGVEEHCVF